MDNHIRQLQRAASQGDMQAEEALRGHKLRLIPYYGDWPRRKAVEVVTVGKDRLPVKRSRFAKARYVTIYDVKLECGHWVRQVHGYIAAKCKTKHCVMCS